MMKDCVMVKRLCVALVCLLLMVMLLCAVGNLHSTHKDNGVYYGRTATLKVINSQRGRVEFVDCNGNDWFWYCDTNNIPWQLEDTVILTLWDAGTQYLYDDTLVSITTEGIILNTVTK